MGKKIKYIAYIIISLFGIFVIGIYTYHLVKLNQEKKKYPPIGEMVEVYGHDMHVYTEGEGEGTIVFLAGGGTSAPVLDFKPLLSQLSDSYEIAVVEKSGYGWSETAEVTREIDFILDETRTALAKTGHSPPYVIAPHSMSGLEAIRWAQLYPNEVEAIIGLDMATPEVYEVLDIPSPIIQSVASFAARIGVLRLFPNMMNESAAIDSGNLSKEDEDIYRALFQKSTLTKNMVDEVKEVVDNADKVNNDSIPKDVPMLLFISNGEEIGLDEWPTIAMNYVNKIDNHKIIHMGSHHYVHTYEPEVIAEEVQHFLEEIIK